MLTWLRLLGAWLECQVHLLRLDVTFDYERAAKLFRDCGNEMLGPAPIS